MKCPECQAEIIEEARFCNTCSCDLTKVKPGPSKTYDHPQSYTPKHLADKILTSRSAIEGERKLVTVLFADVAQYTSMAEKLDPEDVHQIMDGCFRILMDGIHKYEGTINQFTGDGVMALFGAPLAYENHAHRACCAALAVLQAIKGYSEELKSKFGLEFKMRVGLNSGPVVVGSIGDDLRMDYTAIGDTTNLASRLESMAEPGSILVSGNTYKKVRQYFEFNPLGKTPVKGRGEPLEVYELKGMTTRPWLGSPRKIYSELVDREKELNKLELHLLKVINGEGSVVNVIGEPGIGKSRLVAELKRKDAISRVLLLEGRAVPIGKNMSFHPIIDVLKRWARIREDDGEPESIEKLESAVRSVCLQEVGEIFPFIAILMGMKLTGKHEERVKGIEGEALEKLILKSLRDLMMKTPELSPTVYVLEDLHWSDLTTIEFLESLFRLAADHRILFINVFRPNYKETGDRLARTVREKYGSHHTEIFLEPLDEDQCEVLISNLIKAKVLPRATRKRIIERAEGNPFFIEEVVRSFIDEGIVELADGHFKISQRIDSVIIPETIRDVLVARIDKLDEETKDLLKVASVIGRNFFHRILVEVAKPIEDIDKKLGYLKEVQLIRQRERMGEIEYLFKHGLTQEATYQSILLKKRKELHLRVAGSIESVFADRLHNFYGILAYHYSNGEDLDKAEEYLIKAGEEALKSSASSEALNYYQEGLKLYLLKYGDAADPDKLAMLKKNIALAFFNKGQYTNALEYFDSVLEHWGAGLSKNRILRAFRLGSDLLNLVANLYLPSRKARKTPDKRDSEILNLNYKRSISLVYVDSKRLFVGFLSVLRRLNAFDITKIENGVGIWTSASGLFSWTGISFKLSKKILEFAEDVINKENIKELLYYDLFELLYKFFTGNWRYVKECDERLCDLNLRIGECWHVSTYIVFNGFIKVEQGAFRETEAMIGKLSEIWDAYENENAREYQYSLKIRLLIKTRKLYDAQFEVDAGISFQSQTGRELAVIYYLGHKAITQIFLKDTDEARESLVQARKLVQGKDRIPPSYISSYLIGQFLFDLCLLEQAIVSNDKPDISSCRKKAYHSGKHALRNSAKNAIDRPEILTLMGLYWWLIGRQNRAIKWWRNSMKEGERLGARVELARTYMEVGKRLLKKGSRYRELNGIEAQGYLEKARVLFEEMGLQWDLEELHRIIAYR